MMDNGGMSEAPDRSRRVEFWMPSTKTPKGRFSCGDVHPQLDVHHAEGHDVVEVLEQAGYDVIRVDKDADRETVINTIKTRMAKLGI